MGGFGTSGEEINLGIKSQDPEKKDERKQRIEKRANLIFVYGNLRDLREIKKCVLELNI
jgi:hypothetical protein